MLYGLSRNTERRQTACTKWNECNHNNGFGNFDGSTELAYNCSCPFFECICVARLLYTMQMQRPLICNACMCVCVCVCVLPTLLHTTIEHKRMNSWSSKRTTNRTNRMKLFLRTRGTATFVSLGRQVCRHAAAYTLRYHCVHLAHSCTRIAQASGSNRGAVDAFHSLFWIDAYLHRKRIYGLRQLQQRMQFRKYAFAAT